MQILCATCKCAPHPHTLIYRLSWALLASSYLLRWNLYPGSRHALPPPHLIALGSPKDPPVFRWATSHGSKGLPTHILSSWYFDCPHHLLSMCPIADTPQPSLLILKQGLTELLGLALNSDGPCIFNSPASASQGEQAGTIRLPLQGSSLEFTLSSFRNFGVRVSWGEDKEKQLRKQEWDR